jgi:hypothetical protein
MLIFDCTQSACEFFSSKVKGQLVSHVQPASAAETLEVADATWPAVDRWQLHCVKFGRTNVLVAVQVDTRFAMTFVKLKPGDVKGFLEQFCGRYQIELLLLADNTQVPLPPQTELQRHAIAWAESMSPAYFFKRNDRSVQSHITQVLDYADQVAYEKGLPVEVEDVIAFDMRVNRFLRKIGGKGDYFHPDEEMLLRVYPVLGGTLSVEGVKERDRPVGRGGFHRPDSDDSERG